MIIKQPSKGIPHKMVLYKDIVLEFEYNDLPECDYWFFKYKSKKNELPNIKVVQGINLLRGFNELEFKSIMVLADKVDRIGKNNLQECVFFCEETSK